MDEKSDRRHFYRQAMHAPIHFFQIETDEGEHSVTVDLSFGGLSFVVNRFMPAGSSIDIRIPVDSAAMALQGRVAYCCPLDGTRNYRIGIAFNDEGSAFRARLAVQMQKIRQFQKELCSIEGREISEDEAALLWIRQYAEHFAKNF